MKDNVIITAFCFQRLTLYKLINNNVIGYSKSEIERDERCDLMKDADDITQP